MADFRETGCPVRGSGPQGLRRPRFSFFRFTCQTSRNLAAPSPAKAEAAETRRHPPWPQDHGRMLCHRMNSEGASPTRHRAKRRRAKRTYIGWGGSHCQPFRRRNSVAKIRRAESYPQPSYMTAGAPSALASAPDDATVGVFARPRTPPVPALSVPAAQEPHSYADLNAVVSGGRDRGVGDSIKFCVLRLARADSRGAVGRFVSANLRLGFGA
jgi:hypothetical protein